MSTEGQVTFDEELEEIVSCFPKGITHAFGYGSGVFHQSSDISSSSTKDELPMIDLIFAVDDPLSFHSANLSLHRHHYSSLMSFLGPNAITLLQCSPYGAGVYFNPFVSSPNNNSKRLIKYGVVSTSDLIRDLDHWEYLYLAGRMQKPTVAIRGYQHPDVVQSQHSNLKAALSASLLLLNDHGHQQQQRRHCQIDFITLFQTIANLSYVGDIRMMIGAEHPNKIQNLVRSPGQLDRFVHLYQHPMDDLERKGILSVHYPSKTNNDDVGYIEFDSFQSIQNELFQVLPPKFRNLNNGGCSIASAAILSAALSSVVAPAARNQTLKGLLTAGIWKSAKYAGAKFAKRWRF